MAVFRIEKNTNYTVMSNYHLRDKKLTFKAKGMLSFMLSLPDNWDYSLNGLCSVSKEGIKAIRSILQELEQQKYLKRMCTHTETGCFDYDYYIYEQPYKEEPDIQNSDIVSKTKTSKKNTKKNTPYTQKGNTVRVTR